MHRFAIRVRYGDTDQMGFAYYGNYLRWFEIGRAELLRAAGLSYREVEAGGIRLPVLEARCRYLKPARYDDLLVVETAVAAIGRASVTFAYRIRQRPAETLLAWGSTEHCFLDADGRPVRAPEALAALLRRVPVAEVGPGPG